MRPEKLYLTDIIEAADAVERFVDDIEQTDFEQDELRQSAVLQKLIVIGEAAARVPKTLQARHPHVEWPDIVAFRNIAVHEYFAVSWAIVWVTATQDVPLLREQIGAILKAEFSEE